MRSLQVDDFDLGADVDSLRLVVSVTFELGVSRQGGPLLKLGPERCRKHMARVMYEVSCLTRPWLGQADKVTRQAFSCGMTNEYLVTMPQSKEQYTSTCIFYSSSTVEPCTMRFMYYIDTLKTMYLEMASNE